MKNAGASSEGEGKKQPRDIVERTFQFAVRIVQLCGKLDELRPLVSEAEEIKRVIGAIVVSAKRTGTGR